MYTILELLRRGYGRSISFSIFTAFRPTLITVEPYLCSTMSVDRDTFEKTSERLTVEFTVWVIER